MVHHLSQAADFEVMCVDIVLLKEQQYDLLEKPPAIC